ncbi:Meiotic Sister-Chromatid recombination aldehyde dehydrogenase [Myotisia sp. PD_48]|nr:Meiotic Sister-Chromatid recombination aldehyde dehydrogenase [Myotisia sp. PD_48]
MEYLLFVYDEVSNWTATQLTIAIFTFLTAVCSSKLCASYFLERHEQPVKFDIPLPDELKPGWMGRGWDDLSPDSKKILEGQMNGVWNEHKILSYSPADGRLLGDENGIKPASRKDIDLAFQRAEEAQSQWCQTDFGERRKVLRTLLKYILEHQDEIATACCLDSGKTMVDASLGDILVTAEKLKWTILHGEKALQTDRRPTNLLMMYKKNTVRYEPLGVVAACVSWNYPFHNLISPVISAIFAGNSIIVKPSEHTAWSSLFLCDMIRRAIVACGHPADIVQTVVCLAKDGDALTSHPLLRHLIFIGSKPVAHEICKSAAKSLVPVTVELGGKDPVVILDDSATVKDITSIASIVMRGVFQSAGQNCVGAERIIALSKVYDLLLEQIIPRIKALVLGSVMLEHSLYVNGKRQEPNTPDVGAQISTRSFDRLEALIAAAVRDGAKLLAGGKRVNHHIYPYGHYFAPTLLAGVTPDMEIAQTELFAPIFLLMRAQSVNDAISLANSTSYALGASVFGQNREDVEKCVSGIKAGMVAVNDFGTYYAVGLPFGGLKDSGYGRFGGAEGLRNLSNLKAVCMDRFPFIQTKIPAPLDYPINKGPGIKNNGQGAWEFCKGVVETGYQPSLGGKVSGITKILKNI